MIKTYLKCPPAKKILCMQLSINLISRKLQRYFFAQFIRSQRKFPIDTPFTDYLHQNQNSSTVTNQWILSKDRNFRPIWVVFSCSELPLAPVTFVDIYSLNSTNTIPLWANTTSNAIANPSRTLYHLRTAPNIQTISNQTGPSASVHHLMLPLWIQ